TRREWAAARRKAPSFSAGNEVTKRVAMSPDTGWFEVEPKSIRRETLERPMSSHANDSATLATGGGATQGSARSGLALAAYRWRQVRLGCGFVQFGATALAVAFLFAPVARFLAPDREQAELAVQRTIRRAYAFSVALWKLIGIFRLDARALAALPAEGPCIVVANHPTLTDVVLIGSFLE